MTKETKLTKKEIQVIKALQHGDIFVSKAGVEMIVDFVTDDRVVTTVRQGTIKAPDRLVFTYQEFINGMKSLRVKKGNKFKISVTKIIRDSLGYEQERSPNCVEGIGKDEFVKLSEIPEKDINNKGGLIAISSDRDTYRVVYGKFVSEHSGDYYWTSEYKSILDINEAKNKLPDMVKGTSFGNDYGVTEILITKRQIFNSYSLGIDSFEIINDREELKDKTKEEMDAMFPDKKETLVPMRMSEELDMPF